MTEKIMFKASQAGAWAACTKKGMAIHDRENYSPKKAMGMPVGLLAGSLVHTILLDGGTYTQTSDLVAYDRSTPDEQHLNAQVCRMVEAGKNWLNDFTFGDEKLEYRKMLMAHIKSSSREMSVSGIADAIRTNGNRALVDFKVSTRLVSDTSFHKLAVLAWIMKNTPDEDEVEAAYAVNLKRSKTVKDPKDLVEARVMKAEQLIELGDGLIRRALTAGEGFPTPTFVACSTCPLADGECSFAPPKS